MVYIASVGLVFLVTCLFGAIQSEIDWTWHSHIYTCDNITELENPTWVHVKPHNYKCIPKMYGEEWSVAIYIRSSPSETATRKMLRGMWIEEARQLGMFVVFLVGNTLNKTELRSLESEGNTYGDMIVLNSFYDNYLNLSLKSRDLFRWHMLNERPDIPTVVLWTNTDGFIYPRNLDMYIRTHDVLNSPNVIHGQCTCSGDCRYPGPIPLRDPKGKWYMPYKVYPAPHYPQYCIAYSVIFTPGTAEIIALLVETRFLMDFTIDDVLLTGVFMMEGLMKLQATETFIGMPQFEECVRCVALHTMSNQEVIDIQWSFYKNHTAMLRTPQELYAAQMSQ